VPDLPARLAQPAFTAVPPKHGRSSPAASTQFLRRGRTTSRRTSPVSAWCSSAIRTTGAPAPRRARRDRLQLRPRPGTGVAAVEHGAGPTTPARCPCPIARASSVSTGLAARPLEPADSACFVNPAVENGLPGSQHPPAPVSGRARMRRAVNYAIDRPALAGLGAPIGAGRPTDQTVPFGIPGFRDAADIPSRRSGFGEGEAPGGPTRRSRDHAHLQRRGMHQGCPGSAGRPPPTRHRARRARVVLLGDVQGAPRSRRALGHRAGGLVSPITRTPSKLHQHSVRQPWTRSKANFGRFHDPGWDRRMRAAAAPRRQRPPTRPTVGSTPAIRSRLRPPIAPYSNTTAPRPVLEAHRLPDLPARSTEIDLTTLCVRR